MLAAFFGHGQTASPEAKSTEQRFCYMEFASDKLSNHDEKSDVELPRSDNRSDRLPRRPSDFRAAAAFLASPGDLPGLPTLPSADAHDDRALGTAFRRTVAT